MICVLLFGKRILLSNVMNELGKLHSSYLRILPSCGSTGKPLINPPEALVRRTFVKCVLPFSFKFMESI